jgi:alpha-L-rhamnosidase
MKDDPSMNSYNHYAYGAVADWLYRFAAGVDTTPLGAGIQTVFLHPVFSAQLGSVAFDYSSAYGPIQSDWTVEGKTATWHVSLPANTIGWLSAAAKYKLGGVPLSKSPQAKAASHDGESGFELPAGSYIFQADVD